MYKVPEIALGLLIGGLIFLQLSCSEEFQNLGPDPVETFLKLHGGDANEVGADILKTAEGYVMLGTTYSGAEEEAELYLVATNEGGEQLWTKNIPVDVPGVSGMGNALLSLQNGNYLACGKATDANQQTDAWVVLFSSTGAVIWQMRYGGQESQETAVAMALAENGDVFLLGTTTAINPVKTEGPRTAIDSTDIYVAKIDIEAGGVLLWEKAIGYTGIDEAADIISLSDGNFAILGTTDYPETGIPLDKDLWVSLMNSEGNIFHTQIFGDSADDEWGRQMIQASDGNLVVVGYADPEMGARVIEVNKMNLQLESLWSKRFGTGQGNSVWGQPDGSLMLTGNNARNLLFLKGIDANGMDIPGLTEQTFGYSSSVNSIGASLIATIDGGVAVVGTLDFETSTMMMQLKTNAQFQFEP